MRLWVHKIWLYANDCPLHTGGPKENAKFESLLHEEGEAITALAWAMYVFEEPRMYNLEPVKHVDEMQLKSGGKWVQEIENQSAITRFPLSAFLATAEGYCVKARLELETNDKENREYQRLQRIVGEAKQPSKFVKSAWNVPETQSQ